jgi:hypothetical protein
MTVWRARGFQVTAKSRLGHHAAMHVRGLLIASLVTLPALAQDQAPVALSYSAYSNGLNVIDLQARLSLTPQTYRLEVSYRLTGLVGFVIHGESTTTVDGEFRGDTPEPRALFSTGHLRGRARVTQIEWQNGSPVIVQMQPPVEEERDPVPTAEQAHTIDTLSAMAALLHEVAANGRCEGRMTTFDGRRLSIVEAHTVGDEDLPVTSRSSFHGPALRCDFSGRQLAGFIRDTDQEALRQPQHGSAWFARLVPGGPPVPVRITFETRIFGPATMYLTGAS